MRTHLNDENLPAMQPREPGDPYRYGIYLRPDARTCGVIQQVTALLRAQYGLVSAAAFPPHATLVGRQQFGVDEGQIVNAIGTALTGLPPVGVHNRGVRPQGVGWVFDIHHRPDGTVNDALTALAARVDEAVGPLRSPLAAEASNDFDPATFRAHLSLASHDLFTRPDLREEIGAFLTELDPSYPKEFTASHVALYRTECSDWTGRWWTTMRWEHVKSWPLSA